MAMDRILTTSFRMQANALLRKNVIFQKRKMATNICLISFPVILCALLVIFQVIINKALNGPNHQCGCSCVPTNDTSVCKDMCGIEYSTPSQAIFCAIPKPPHWPAVLQVPSFPYRAVDEHINEFPGLPDISCRWWGTCPTSFLYTGANQSIGDGIVSGFFSTPSSLNTSDLLLTLAELVPGTRYGIPSSNFLETAFYNGREIYILQPSCSSLTYSYYSCVETLLLWRDNSTSINRELYQGYFNGNPANMINEITAAYDFGSTSLQNFDVTIWYNDTKRSSSINRPPGLLRLPRSMNLVSQAYLRLILGSSAQLPLWFISEMPKLTTRIMLDFSSLLGPLFFMWVIQLLYPVIIATLVYEKQQKLRIMMKMHGLEEGAYWLITYFFFLLVSVVYMICFMIFGSLIGLNFFKRNSYGIQCIFYFVYINLQIAMGFLSSIFFSKTSSATAVGYQYVFGFGLLGAFLFQSFVEEDNFPKQVLFLMELLPGFALYRGLYEFSQYSITGYNQGTKGMQWKNLRDPENGVCQVITIMLTEWILIMPLSYYLDRLMNSRNFSYIKGFLHRIQENGKFPADGIVHLDLHIETSDVSNERIIVQEAVNAEILNYAIVCDNLWKTYSGKNGEKSKDAVQGLSIAIPRGQCFGMLGPNGAGKTSTINMMIGLSIPSSGTAYVEGLDIRKDMDQIHLYMGVCPQFDLLWETLTGREHLLFYGRLKNLNGNVLEDAVVNALRSVNLLNGGFGDRLVATYSGGMKRRLSVAISLVGNPKVVYMDEPSAGLDPASRNFLWNVVKNSKQGRAIILTTHSMEEAEALCDRVGIFVKGKLQCIGTAEELKSRYGGLYLFTISTPPSQEEEVLKLVNEMSSTSKRIYSLSGTQKFEISRADVSIADVFRSVVNAKMHIDIQAWGFTDTTLEDVFTKVVDQAS